jgi:hypothetical protein
MVDETIDRRQGHGLIREDFSPFAERLTAGRGGGGGGSLVFCGMTIKAPTMNLMGISVGLWTNEISLPFTLTKSPSSRIGSAERHLNCVVSPFCESRNSAVTVPSSPPLSTETTIRRVHSSGVLRPKTLFLNRPATFAAVMSSCIGPRVRRVGLPSEAASGSRGLSVHRAVATAARDRREHSAAVLVGVEVNCIGHRRDTLRWD